MTAAEEWRPVVGQVFGGWTVLEIPAEEYAKLARKRQALCRCICGREKMVWWHNLRYGLSKACHGCSMRKTMTKHAATAGRKEGRLYKAWKSMKWRCSSNNLEDKPDYFERGIRVCEEWANSFPAFRNWALANGYRDDLTLDRWPDNNGNYEPGNCRWATTEQQARNTRRNRYLTAWGETKLLVEWSEDPRCGIPKSVLATRLWQGWSEEEAVMTPLRVRPASASPCRPDTSRAACPRPCGNNGSAST